MKASFLRRRVTILLSLMSLLVVYALIVSTSAAEEKEKTGWLGVSMQRLTPDLLEVMDVAAEMGVLVTDVVEDSPAEEAGIEVGDVIVEYDGKTVKTPHSLSRLVRKTAPGTKVKVKISREGKEKTLTVEIGERGEIEEKSSLMIRGEEGKDDRLLDFYGDLALPGLSHLLCHGWGINLWLGIRTVDLTEQLAKYFGVKDDRGVLVSEVVEDSPAEKAGLKTGDVIVKADGERIDGTLDLHEVIDEHEEGDQMELLVVRQGTEKKLKATLEERPHRELAKVCKKLKKLPRKLKRMKILAPYYDLPEIDLDLEEKIEVFEMEKIEQRLEELKEELDRIKDKLEMD